MIMNDVRHRQTIAPQGLGVLRLPVSSTGVLHARHGSYKTSIASPYFRLLESAHRKVGTGRDTQLSLATMKLIISDFIGSRQNTHAQMQLTVSPFDGSDTIGPDDVVHFDITNAASIADIVNAAKAFILGAYASAMGYTLSASDLIWPNDVAVQIAAILVPPVASALSLSLQTSTGAVGTQVSTTRSSYVMLNGNVSTTASIGGNAAGDIILEVAPTNSATAGDWVEWGRIGNSQAITLALTLNSVQVTKGMVVAFVPAGYYVKARTAGSGTVSYTLTNAKQILV